MEYLIKEKLASSIDIMAGNLVNLDTTDVEIGDERTRAMRSLNLDMHETGWATEHSIYDSLLSWNRCGNFRIKNQLGPQLGATRLYNCRGDFSRSARTTGTGSDHGFNQMVHLFLQALLIMVP